MRSPYLATVLLETPMSTRHMMNSTHTCSTAGLLNGVWRKHYRWIIVECGHMMVGGGGFLFYKRTDNRSGDMEVWSYHSTHI